MDRGRGEAFRPEAYNVAEFEASDRLIEDHWAAVEELFYAALDGDPAARVRVLDAKRELAPAVVAEVESLLAHADGTALLETALGLSRTQAAAPELDASPDRELYRVGRSIGHYRVTAFIGAGGMGSVYRAKDVALGRDAALKLLPHGFTPAERALLLTEADACARLQHPGIATFFEAGEADGETFIAMEYVSGESLRRRIMRGPLPLDDALTVTRGILEALGHAHAAGLIHRDIKPENVVITESGAAKLLDFGIATRILPGLPPPVHGAANRFPDRTGLVGTPGYLAPEQVLGETLDARTDLYQVGLLLVEMLIGRRTIAGTSIFEQIAAVLTRPRDVGALRHQGVPESLIAIIERATARDPSTRYPSAAAFLAALERVNPTSTALPPTLAVVDFDTAHAEDAWIGSGLAERLTETLKRASGLRIVPRARVVGALRAADPKPESDLVRAGQLIGCRWVLSGRVGRRDDEIEMAITLVDATSGEEIWRGSLNGTLSSSREVEARIIREILRALEVDGPPIAPRNDGKEVEAFECFARARRLFHRLEKGSMQQARELYERAVALEPDHAWSLAGLAAVHAMRYPYQTDPADLARAADYARRAIAADPDLADAYIWLGYALMRLERMGEALAALDIAERLAPDHPFAPYFVGCVHYFSGRPEAAVAPLQRALGLDRHHGFAWMTLGNAHVALGDLTSARWCLEQVIALEQRGTADAPVAAGVYLGEVLRLQGRPDEARSTLMAAIAIAERSDHMYRDTMRGIGLCCLARTALDQRDNEAARVALNQVLAHAQGRDRMLGGGHLTVQALAGLARAGDGVARLDEAHDLFTRRTRFNFSAMGACDDATSLHELARAALTLGLPQGRDLHRRARAAGSYEARLRSHE